MKDEPRQSTDNNCSAYSIQRSGETIIVDEYFHLK